MKLSSLLTLICLLIYPFVLPAQQCLTLTDCIDRAKTTNNRIGASLYKNDLANYRKKEAFYNFFPQISLTGMGIYSTADGSLDVDGGMLPVVGADGVPTGGGAFFPGIHLDYDVDWLYGGAIQFMQPLYAGGKISTGYKLSKVGQSVARQNLRLTESEVVVETTRAYAALVRAEEMSKVAGVYNKLLVELQRMVQKAVDHGVKSRNDLLKIEVKLNESELNMRRAENAANLAAMNLCHYVGLPLDTKIEVSEELPETDYSQPSGTVDISSRPEVQMLADQKEAIGLKVRMARAEMLPSVGLVGQYGYIHGLKLAGDNLLDQWNFTAGVQVSIPLLGLPSRYKIRQAQMEYRLAEEEEADKLGLMTLEATRSANNLDEAALELRLAEKATASAVENLRVSSSQYKVGTETLSDHLEAQALWLQAQQTLIDARINRFLRWMEYNKAIGKIN